jgi:Flp pilus assembly protein TadG
MSEAAPTSTSRRNERGATLMWVAGMLVALLGAAAFAVDLGWLFLNASRVQKAADAAALAGVVNLPTFPADADADARSAAAANGYPTGGGSIHTLTATPNLIDNKLRVDLATQIPTFFLKVLGVTQFNIERTSTAQFILPVPLGSPNNNWGADPADNFWGAVSGPFTAKIHGDPYQSNCDWSRNNPSNSNTSFQCIDSNTTNRNLYFPSDQLVAGDIDPDNSAFNPLYRSAGYYIGIEVPANTSNLRVQLYDPIFMRRSSFSSQTGDWDRLTFTARPQGSTSNTIGPRTHFQLYSPDRTPHDPTDNPIRSGCSRQFDPVAPGSSGAGINAWINLCTTNSGNISNPAAGMWIVRVWTSTGAGTNQYGVRACTNNAGTSQTSSCTSGGMQVFGVNDMSIFTNEINGTANLPLAEILPVHAGKTLELKFFDAGEQNSGNGRYRILMPNGATPNCTWWAQESDIAPSSPPAGATTGPCDILTTQNGTARFNNRWLFAEIEISPSYTCNPNASGGAGCYWRAALTLNNAHDRTTWAARVKGNPVRLVSS